MHLSDIIPKMKRIRKQVLFIRTTLHSHGRNNSSSPNCPQCGGTRLELDIHEHHIKLECHTCFWQDNYMRIRKNGEGVI